MQISTPISEIHHYISQNTHVESPLFLGRYTYVAIPEEPLASGSIAIEKSEESHGFIEWFENDHREMHQTLSKVVTVWNKEGISDFLLYGKSGEDTFRWEVVPYEKSNPGILKFFAVFWKQLKVLANITLDSSGRLPFPDNRLLYLYPIVKAALNQEANRMEDPQVQFKGDDPFCNDEIINRQRVFEGEKVDILYNYAPIAFDDQKLHFLIVPKAHRVTLSDLSEDEYVEAMRLAQKLLRHYKDRNYPTAYLFNKNGDEAGQTVPHWHLHVVFTATKTQEVLGKLIVFKNMVWGHSPLSNAELQERVSLLQSHLSRGLEGL